MQGEYRIFIALIPLLCAHLDLGKLVREMRLLFDDLPRPKTAKPRTLAHFSWKRTHLMPPALEFWAWPYTFT